MSDRLRFGVLGCAAIAVEKVIPAIGRSVCSAVEGHRLTTWTRDVDPACGGGR